MSGPPASHFASPTPTRPTPAWPATTATTPTTGGRAVAPDSSTTRRLDVLQHINRPRTTDPHRVIGAKPAAFCRWIFDLLGAQPGDTLDDLFPGSGAITRAWHTYIQETP